MSFLQVSAILSKRTALVGVVSLNFLLGACGGSAPGASTSSGSGGTTSSAAFIDIQMSTNSIKSAGGTATATVTVLNASRQTLAATPVTVSVDSGSVSQSAASTDTSGVVTATVTGGGSDRSNRTITVTAVSGTVSATATVAVTGTTLTITPSSSSVTVGVTGAYIDFALKDSASQPIANQAVTYSSSLSGASAVSVGTTDATGKVRLSSYAPTTAGTDHITGNGAGTSASIDIVVGSSTVIPPSTAPLDFTVQATPSVVNVNQGTSTTNQAQIAATVTGANGALVQNALVHFRRGDVYATAVASQFSRDTSVAGIPTGATGTASVNLIPGPTTSGNNQVVVCASVETLTVPATTVPSNPCNTNEKPVYLTFAGGALFVRIGTGSTISSVRNDLNYQKSFSVVVTDNAGQPVSGALVSVQLRPRWFGKGRLAYGGTAWGFSVGDGNSGVPATGALVAGGGRATAFPSEAVPEVSVFALWCPNEDRNNNGTLDSGEDFNNDGKLEPGQVATVVIQNSGLTDSTGFVTVTIEYSKTFAIWTVEDIEVRAAVGGSEGSAVYTYWFLASDTDIKAQSTPPFTPSPYGTVTGTLTTYTTLTPENVRRADDCADPR